MLNKKFSVDLSRNCLIVGARRIRLTPGQAELLCVLMDSYGRVVPYDILAARVYGVHWKQFKDPLHVIKVQVNFLRKVLKSTGLKIVTYYGVGFELVETGHKVYTEKTAVPDSFTPGTRSHSPSKRSKKHD